MAQRCSSLCVYFDLQSDIFNVVFKISDEFRWDIPTSLCSYYDQNVQILPTRPPKCPPLKQLQKSRQENYV